MTEPHLLNLSVTMRASLEFDRALTFDELGREIYAGLTRDESEFLAKHRQRGAKRAALSDKQRARDLQRRNDLARGKGIDGSYEIITSAAQTKR